MSALHGNMRCRACGWWPPVVRVRHGHTAPAADSWRWRRLADHVDDIAAQEYLDGDRDGPHQRLAFLLDAIRFGEEAVCQEHL